MSMLVKAGVPVAAIQSMLLQLVASVRQRQYEKDSKGLLDLPGEDGWPCRWAHPEPEDARLKQALQKLLSGISGLQEISLDDDGQKPADWNAEKSVAHLGQSVLLSRVRQILAQKWRVRRAMTRWEAESRAANALQYPLSCSNLQWRQEHLSLGRQVAFTRGKVRRELEAERSKEGAHEGHATCFPCTKNLQSLWD